MTSSDSAEDFESADEDFDFDRPLKHKTEQQSSHSRCSDNEEDAITEQDHSDVVLTNVQQSLAELKIQPQPVQRHSDSVGIEEEIKIVDQSDEHKVQSTSKNPGTTPTLKTSTPTSLPETSKQIEDIPVRQKDNDLSNITASTQKVSDKENKASTKEKTDNQITEITGLDEPISQSGDGWEVEGDEEIDIDDVAKPPSLNKAIRIKGVETGLNEPTTQSSDGWEVEEIDIDNESKPSGKLDKGVKSTVDTVRQSVKNITLDIKSQPGDGWEVEEEDGFEIPATLAKVSDGSIQCAEEQLSELDQVAFRQFNEQQPQGWGGWGSWGVGSLLSTATTGSVTAFSSHVTAGLSTVLETTVGAPDPESLAAASVKKHDLVDPEVEKVSEEPADKEKSVPGSYAGLGSIVSGVSFLGNTVITRGLDTLETLGKKTMEVLQEGDPGLKKKRAMLFHNEDKPVLSKILREAKEKADHSDKEKEEKETARKAHFESLFDDFQGMVHLEALEMLSTQCELKLQTLVLSHSGSQLLDLQETLSQVRDLCELPDEEDDSEVLSREQFVQQVTECLRRLGVNISAAKIIQVNDQVIAKLETLDSDVATVVNQAAISSLAEFTAAAMECFHKSAELVLAKSAHNTADEAESYTQLTSHLCARVAAIASEFTQHLTKHNPIANSSSITNIFLEASNSSSYIRNACQLLVPILQEGAVSS